jgi:hypothetical protein
MKSPEEIYQYACYKVAGDEIGSKSHAIEAIRLAVQEAVEEACKVICKDCRDAVADESKLEWQVRHSRWVHRLGTFQGVVVACVSEEIRDHFEKAGY